MIKNPLNCDLSSSSAGLGRSSAGLGRSSAGLGRSSADGLAGSVANLRRA